MAVMGLLVLATKHTGEFFLECMAKWQIRYLHLLLLARAEPRYQCLWHHFEALKSYCVPCVEGTVPRIRREPGQRRMLETITYTFS